MLIVNVINVSSMRTSLSYWERTRGPWERYKCYSSYLTSMLEILLSVFYFPSLLGSPGTLKCQTTLHDRVIRRYRRWIAICTKLQRLWLVTVQLLIHSFSVLPFPCSGSCTLKVASTWPLGFLLSLRIFLSFVPYPSFSHTSDHAMYP